MFEEGTSPKISIIMPTYNRAGLILETIESVRNQTYSNWELIIIDDGSEDNTEEIVSGVEDKRIRFHKAGKIGIGIKLKSIGIDMADGDLIAFIDSDDLWASAKLEKQVKALNDYPEAAFSLTGGYNFRNKSEPVEYYYKQKEGIKYGDIFISFFTDEASILTPTIMFEKRCMPVIRQFAETTPSSDVEFILGLALHFKAIILYEPLLYRRLHDKGYSILNWEKGYYEGIKIIKKYRANNALPSKIARNSLFKLYIHSGEKYLSFKKKKKAIACFLQAWKYKPISIIPLKKTGKAIFYYLSKK